MKFSVQQAALIVATYINEEAINSIIAKLKKVGFLALQFL